MNAIETAAPVPVEILTPEEEARLHRAVEIIRAAVAKALAEDEQERHGETAGSGLEE
jgi:hypothetical protein